MMRVGITIISVLAFCLSCQKDINSYGSYLKYLNDPANGLVKTHSTNGLDISIKYLPLDYLVLNELRHEENFDENLIHRLKVDYATSTTFLMTLGPAKGKDFDVTKVGVANFQEFSERILSLTFGLKDDISLTVGTQKYSPAITHLEELFGLQNKRNILIVFNLSEEERAIMLDGDFSVVYEDHIFNTAISQFIFQGRSLKNTPTINYSQI